MDTLALLGARFAAANEAMINLNDELARLQGQARTVEAALLETNGQRKELQHLIRETRAALAAQASAAVAADPAPDPVPANN